MKKIFLSSTFCDLKEERREVEKVIHRMGDVFEGMEYFGASQGTPLSDCLHRVRNSEIYILVVGYRHGHIPNKRKRSMTEREFYEAKKFEIPTFVYVADKEFYYEETYTNEKILAFRRMLREKYTAPCFRSPSDLAAQVAADLCVHYRQELTRIPEDAGSRLSGHIEVITAMSLGEIYSALKLNSRLLDMYPDSPRAHYNQACILSKLSGKEPNRRQTFLRKALRHLNNSLKLGILEFIQIYENRPENFDVPAQDIIINDVDLAELFREIPIALSAVKEKGIDLRQPTSCGC